eukprot:1215760-Amorphochlora_amoeboformis.AAC.1
MIESRWVVGSVVDARRSSDMKGIDYRIALPNTKEDYCLDDKRVRDIDILPETFFERSRPGGREPIDRSITLYTSKMHTATDACLDVPDPESVARVDSTSLRVYDCDLDHDLEDVA